MAISKILHMGSAKSGFKAKHLANAIDYITKPEKTEGGVYVSGHNCLPEYALNQMLQTKHRFHKLDKRQGYHIIISFEEEKDTVDKDIAFNIIKKFTEEYLGEDFEAVCALHDDVEHIHGHIVFNSVRCTRQGLKYEYKKGDWERYIQPLVNRICEEYQMATLDLEEVRSKRIKRNKKEWDKSNQGPFVWDEMIKKDIDQAIAVSNSYDGFLDILQDLGYKIVRGKHDAVCPLGMVRNRRLDTLKGEYTQNRIKERIHQGESCAVQEDNSLIQISSPNVLSKKRQLNGYQRTYFARLYRLNVLRKRQNTEYWKYAEDIKEFHRLQEEYSFLTKYNIQNMQMLKERISLLKSTQQDISNQMEDCHKYWSEYKPVLELFQNFEEMQVGASLYKEEGYEEFRADYEKSIEIAEIIRQYGYTIPEIEHLVRLKEQERSSFQSEIKEVRKEERIGKRILNKELRRLKERELKEQNQLKQKEKEK